MPLQLTEWCPYSVDRQALEHKEYHHISAFNITRRMLNGLASHKAPLPLRLLQINRSLEQKCIFISQ